jgi:hypothetical protein
MKLKIAIAILKEYIEDTKNLSCCDTGADYGIYPCCGNASYEGHEKDCINTKVDKALKTILINLI